MGFVRKLMAVLVLAAVSFVMSGCDTSSDDIHGLTEKNLKLSDGRIVTCIQNDRGNSISCDWDHTVK